MIDKKLSIVMADGTSHSILMLPDEKGSYPGIIFLTDIFGIRPSNIMMAKRLCEQGYAVLVPNVFFRSGEVPLFPLPVDRENPGTQTRIQELIKSMTAADMGKDMRHYAEYLQAQQGVGAGRLGAVGYCFTGQMALLGAAAAPDEIGVAVSFHGGRLYTDAPDSPHTFLPRVKAKLYFGHAKDDESMPAESIEKFEAALKSWGGTYDSKTYGAGHGWTVPDNPAYNKDEAEAAFTALTGFLKHAAGE